MSKRVILASNSPRRKELLKKIADDFDVVSPDVDESIDNIKIEEIPAKLAQRKANAVFKNNQDCIVIGADTVVILDNELMGKPKDKEDARRMLMNLSGKTHKVITGCAIISSENEVHFSVVTEVTFFMLSAKEIEDYVNSGEPLDKAGAYGIQGLGYSLVEKINGDYNNVVGLPISLLNKKLKSIT